VILDYFTRNGAACPNDMNPAEHIVDVVQGRLNPEVDWNQVWEQSKECRLAIEELETLKQRAAAEVTEEEDLADYATPKLYQLRLVLERQMVKLWRSPVSIPLSRLRSAAAKSIRTISGTRSFSTYSPPFSVDLHIGKLERQSWTCNCNYLRFSILSLWLRASSISCSPTSSKIEISSRHGKKRLVLTPHLLYCLCR
jgi:hypothetical protein